MAAFCAWEGAAAHKKKLIAAQAAERRSGRVITCKVFSLARGHLSRSMPSCKISHDDKSAGNKKAPRDARGLAASLFLAKSAGLCGTGGWPGLRLIQPITVAGPRPIRTAFPASLACQLKNQCKPRAREVSMQVFSWDSPVRGTKGVGRGVIWGPWAAVGGGSVRSGNGSACSHTSGSDRVSRGTASEE